MTKILGLSVDKLSYGEHSWNSVLKEGPKHGASLLLGVDSGAEKGNVALRTPGQTPGADLLPPGGGKRHDRYSGNVV